MLFKSSKDFLPISKFLNKYFISYNSIYLLIELIFLTVFQDTGTMTEPPPKVTFSSNASQWEIFDAYIEDTEKQVSFKLT